MLNKEKLNVNPVREYCISPKNQKGITLIALIITIIVMLILVGVTITVAMEGGLFNTAKASSKQTQIESYKEILQSAVVGAIKTDGTVDFEILDENLPIGWTGTNGTYTSPKGNKFTVDENGKITEVGNEETPNPGEEPTPPDSGEDTTPVLPEGLTVGSEFEMDADQDGAEETWIVLYDGTAGHLNENEIEVISKNTMGEDLVLGETDTEAIENATDINGNGTAEDIEIAIYSYNNAIDRINNYCNGLIKIGNLGVRSVGSLPSNPSYRNTSKPYTNQNLAQWTNQTVWNTYGVLGEDGDTNSNDDYTQMGTIVGIQMAGDGKGYWLASRDVWHDFWAVLSCRIVRFYVRSVDSLGRRSEDYLWYVTDGRGEAAFEVPNRVRPVVKLQYP